MINSTKLSTLRIFIVALIYIAIPFAAEIIGNILTDKTIAETLVLCTASLILIVMNFDVLELHAKRLHNKIGDFILFIAVTLFLSAFIFFINQNFLHVAIWAPNPEAISHYLFFTPTIIFAYTYGTSFCFMIAFKALTDRFKVTVGEKTIIFLSGILFGAITTLSFCLFVFDFTTILTSFIYYGLLSIVASYSYNQTHSILPMAFGYGTMLLLFLF